MTTITEQMQLPMREIESEAQQVQFGRAVATFFTAIFVAVGWVVGATWYGIKHLCVATRYGYRQGARVQRVPENSKQ